MIRIVNYTLLAALLVVLAGCAFLQPATDQAARAIRHICKEPVDARLAGEARLNAAAAPHSVTLHCDGDPPR